MVNEGESANVVRRKFLKEEVERLMSTNSKVAEARSISASQRDTGRRKIVVACMDERNALTEEALGLEPTLVQRFASGGGKVGAENFLHLHASLLEGGGQNATIYLTTHEVVGAPELGCAAFKCDLPEQERYFTTLRRELAKRLPRAIIHALSYDTATDGLRGIELDPCDKDFVALVTRGGNPLAKPRADRAHGGFGIYVGDWYRAWVDRYGTHFHISAGAPSLRDDLNIALGVMLHHSEVDLSDKPIIVLIDRPMAGADSSTVEHHRQAAVTVNDFLRSLEAMSLMESGRMRLVELETDPGTWSGRIRTVLN
ncbi:hypothetical protein COY93_00095 [Candidatus Uhrbacteria bacterium CG_4_10_14_0_8_um_filter_58_22]|uniref:Uncharacterized protein n=1 Tax=Candidatus Uhrbacteria bacterium CG_4_10_14_0_8_um_filter_58_22 TaxID=1975029 RepID=A0A2M7QBZ4_9BACT|nr:MAG: hypothetical protein AUJ19_02660 [Parcubacteria group bacterium CG1_02_58_44]PIY63390.1 MAG: hypothetical protein COY93_00095 [Candidatus Uhrbacteria bacterium CG_4_10_14_0_8_um_filter_58_22]